MCGIAGWFDHSRASDPARDKDILHRMCERLVHRGPDQEGAFIGPAGKGTVALGIRRLSVIDLSTGNQPIHNEDKTVRVVCNGEIYNFRELRAELEKRGHRFSTNSDVEVIVHLYEEKGRALLQDLRGMFAFALWDSKKNELFISRDRVGKKPLVYAVDNGRLLFGSEIKALLAFDGFNRGVNREAIDRYLSYRYVPAPLTAFDGIYKLPPAHYMTCDVNGSIKIERYWNVDFSVKLDLSEAQWEELILGKLEEATRIRMVSDVPLGAFLSGGVDSSAVVAMMAKHASKPVKTFSIGFGEEDFSELKYASLVARHFGTDHHEFVVRPKAADMLSKLAWFYGEPFADSSALPSYYVAQQTRRQVTVALNGDGGDESFAGYLRYRAFKLSLRLAPVNGVLSRTAPLADLLMRRSKGRTRKLLRQIHQWSSALKYPPAARNAAWHSVFTRDDKQLLYTSEMRQLSAGWNSARYLEELYEKPAALDAVDRLLYTDISSYLPECLLVKMDIASMANSLEARSPFLDHELIELAAKIPSSLKLRGLKSKYVLKKALAKILPNEILRRRKMGFGVPVDHWFRGELKEYLKDTVLSRAAQRGYFTRVSVEKLIDEHVRGNAEHGKKLWSLLMLELWHKEYIDK